MIHGFKIHKYYTHILAEECNYYSWSCKYKASSLGITLTHKHNRKMNHKLQRRLFDDLHDSLKCKIHIKQILNLSYMLSIYTLAVLHIHCLLHLLCIRLFKFNLEVIRGNLLISLTLICRTNLKLCSWILCLGLSLFTINL